jgi:hypothetical protein
LGNLAYGNDRFVTTGYILDETTGYMNKSALAYSLDGINWTITYNSPSSTEHYSNITYGSYENIGYFIAGGTNGYIIKSRNGIDWEKEKPFLYEIYSTSYGKDGFVAVGGIETFINSRFKQNDYATEENVDKTIVELIGNVDANHTVVGSGATSSGSNNTILGSNSKINSGDNSIIVGPNNTFNGSNNVIITHDLITSQTLNNIIQIGTDDQTMIRLGPITIVFDGNDILFSKGSYGFRMVMNTGSV